MSVELTETNAQTSTGSVHWCPDTPPLGSVRFVEFELGNQSPKLDLVTVR